MFKVLVWDYAGISAQWLERFADMRDIEIVGTITLSESAPEILLKKDAWDWLLIFEQEMRNFFDITIEILNLPKDKIIYAQDINSWLQHPKSVYTLLSDSGGNKVRRQLIWEELKKFNKFITGMVGNTSYIAKSTESFGMPYIFVNGVSLVLNDLKRFYELAKQYYNVDDSSGYFLDLGANIGTSGLYFTKNIAPNLKLIAFEPDPGNFKMHRVNLILNDMEEKANLINCGLGNETGELMLYRNGFNSGAIGFIKHSQSTPIKTIKIIPLDAYFAENEISAREVKYIWIDTEGFEPQVLLGAKNLLRENPAPIFMECNLRAWDNSGYFEDMMTLLSESYSHFVLIRGNGGTLYPLEALRTLERPNNPLGQIGDIFLIRKGAIN